MFKFSQLNGSYFRVLLKCFLLILAGVVVSACGTRKTDWAEFCSSTIWKEHGYYDAKKGFSYRLMGVYKERCGNDFSSSEELLYQAGYLKGIKEFCTYENGLTFGSKNEPNPKSCPFELAEAFDKGYRSGKALYIKTENFVKDHKVGVEQHRQATTSHGHAGG